MCELRYWRQSPGSLFVPFATEASLKIDSVHHIFIAKCVKSNNQVIKSWMQTIQFILYHKHSIRREVPVQSEL